MSKNLDTQPGQHPLNLFEVNPEPIHQKLVVRPKKAVTKDLVIRYVLGEQAFFFEHVYTTLCETQRILRAPAATPQLAADYFYQSSFLKIAQASSYDLLAFVEECRDLAHRQHPIFPKALEDIAVRCFEPE